MFKSVKIFVMSFRFQIFTRIDGIFVISTVMYFSGKKGFDKIIEEIWFETLSSRRTPMPTRNV